MKRPFFIGVAGGSGSGKTTLVQAIRDHFADQYVSVIGHDSYYRDQTHMNMDDRQKTNYDHPKALETDLLIQHLDALQEGKTVQIPVYDFTQHTRSRSVTPQVPTPVIVVEGILLYESTELRKRLDLKLFVDTDADMRLARRLLRDVAERGRTFEFGIEQYLTYTRPMHNEFVEPNRRHADIIIPEGGMNQNALEVIFARIQNQLDRHNE